MTSMPTILKHAIDQWEAMKPAQAIKQIRLTDLAPLNNLVVVPYFKDPNERDDFMMKADVDNWPEVELLMHPEDYQTMVDNIPEDYWGPAEPGSGPSCFGIPVVVHGKT